ncbi:iron chelate uptake ABC transporter family permease subunit [Frigidibacter albus]|uniref:Iron chelate uptake ABC transporter family permease subunit n=1 Tax=Frigidibacter albus TaxID=1465486 RepID=A0A6L8VBG9_9RHOB|nr:iron ABC transporter permease [Frigidibacter albus]MZQ87613.1 iron chelate uptake ABC transporter family permease subunit [Frigidibacter albus]NBE29519.1 iron chelate uptake ABC transporter family permease subunit [Frigidibacter albus]GGH44351.1 ABC transporter permease [Frigidibacter albus]
MSALDLSARVARHRRSVSRRSTRLALALLAVLLAGLALTLMLGQSLTPPLDVLRVLAGHDVPGASFTVGRLRLPRAIISILAGLSFGLGGAACQTLLRSPLASPDIIGISAGSSAAAVFAIVVLAWTGPAVSVLAVVCGLGTACLIYLLAWRGGVAGTRLILVGIGISAMLQSVIAYMLLQAPEWSLQEALRWLTGSVNGARLPDAVPLLLSLGVFGTILLAQGANLQAMQLGDDKAAALGVRLARTRLLTIVAVVGLIAVATAVVGPIAFVAFLSGPIAARIAAPGQPVLIPAALIGAALVLLGDYAGQFLLPGRYPVGVVTGALGAPYLIYLIVRMNRAGGTI